MEKLNYKAIALVLGFLVVSFFFVWYIFAFTEPTSPPPDGNVPAPLNVSINAQAKEGALVVGANSSMSGIPSFIVQYGNVGIGTTSPGATKLAVKGSAASGTEFLITAQNSVGRGLATVFDYDNSVWRIRASGTAFHPIAFNAGGTELMLITSAGKVGIGRSDPAERLHVAGEVRIDGKYKIVKTDTTSDNPAYPINSYVLEYPDGTIRGRRWDTCADNTWCCNGSNPKIGSPDICFIRKPGGTGEVEFATPAQVGCTLLYWDNDDLKDWWVSADQGNECQYPPCLRIANPNKAEAMQAGRDQLFFVCF